MRRSDAPAACSAWYACTDVAGRMSMPLMSRICSPTATRAACAGEPGATRDTNTPCPPRVLEPIITSPKPPSGARSSVSVQIAGSSASESTSPSEDMMRGGGFFFVFFTYEY